MKITVKNLALKRLSFLAGAVLLTAVAPELINGGSFDTSAVIEGSQVALGYWILTTFRDWRDPEIDNK
jgi:uncharacterized membrane protein